MMSNTKIVKQTALVNMSHYKKRVPATLFRKRINSAMCNFGLYYVCFFFIIIVGSSYYLRGELVNFRGLPECNFKDAVACRLL